MTTVVETETAALEKVGKSRIFLLLSLVLFSLGAGLGYFGISGGLLHWGESQSKTTIHNTTDAGIPEVAFVPIPSLTITLPQDAKNTHLRFSAQIEVPKEHQSDVEFLIPRIQDLMNGYLCALTTDDIERPGALFEIRLQLFRRIVMVVGLGRANGLLVTEFILN